MYLKNACHSYGVFDCRSNPLFGRRCSHFMSIIAAPVTLISGKLINNYIDKLISGIKSVADGDLDIYIPTAEAGAFSEVYENFNAMVRQLQSNKILQAEILDGISHELKTPVSSITGCAKMLCEDRITDDKRRMYAELIIGDAEKLTRLFQNTILFSKIDAQTIVTDKQTYNLADQIRDCVIGLQSEWENKNINFSAELTDCIYYGSKALLESVWVNLISNAIKYTPDGGSVSIDMKVNNNNKISVTVSDNGIGMSKHVQEHIFDKYYQGNQVGHIIGHGLGLSIVKKILQLIDGTIDVQSEENIGSSFTVTLLNDRKK